MRKEDPRYSLDFVLHPESDTEYRHFENFAAHPFEPDPAGFARVNAWWLTEAALLTYWPPASAIPIFQAVGFQCEFLTEEDTDCYVASTNDFAIVAFRGTQPNKWEDILADANIVPAPWPTGTVHSGFKKAFNAIRRKLDPKIAQLVPGRTLWFCGHSLGGALATLAAHFYPATRGVCTLGSPRVGDPQFAQAFNAKLAGKTLRYVNDHDVVTHVPLPIGYRHVDTERYIAPNGSVSGSERAIPHFFGDLIGKPRTLLEVINGLANRTLQTAPVFLLDHMPKAYAIWAWNDYDANQQAQRLA